MESEAFNDLTWVKENLYQYQIPKIIGFEYYYDSKAVRGLRAIYQNNKFGPEHKATGPLNIKTKQAIFSADEYITSISGKATATDITLLKIKTSKGRQYSTPSVFASGQKDFTLDLPGGKNAVIAFGG